MDQVPIAGQIMQFNKAFFDNTFKSMTLLQDQSERLFLRLMEKAVWMPDEGKKAINEWVRFYKKGMEDFKSRADENYKKALDYFTQTTVPELYKDKNKS